eukprot:COSAG05_NODE_9241_length_637_cov_1.035316_1_plen_170_part_01
MTSLQQYLRLLYPPFYRGEPYHSCTRTAAPGAAPAPAAAPLMVVPRQLLVLLLLLLLLPPPLPASSVASAGGLVSKRDPSPSINEKVYHHVVSQFTSGHAMFQHFGVSTFGHNNSVGVGGSNDCWHGPNTKPDKYAAPCLPASLFNPANYSARQTMQVAKAFGASEVCIT